MPTGTLEPEWVHRTWPCTPYHTNAGVQQKVQTDQRGQNTLSRVEALVRRKNGRSRHNQNLGNPEAHPTRCGPPAHSPSFDPCPCPSSERCSCANCYYQRCTALILSMWPPFKLTCSSHKFRRFRTHSVRNGKFERN